MRIVNHHELIRVGPFPSSIVAHQLRSEVVAALATVDWPPGSGTFTIFPQSGKKRGEGNGVTPIKKNAMKYLADMGWEQQASVTHPAFERIGNFDALKPVNSANGLRQFAVEWETGNISSSHRSLNRMTLGLLTGALAGGILIVPTNAMARYLTDRIGNVGELIPYFPLYQSLGNVVTDGLLEVVAVEHDATSVAVPRIPKGTDGRALQ